MSLHLQRTPADAAKLKRLHARIRACTKCVAAGYLEQAAPVVAADIADRVMTVGEAPGVVEVVTRPQSSGRAGAELRRWLARAGIGENELPYRTAITKCFPGKAATGAGDRRPSPPEIALCAPWLEAELALVRPQVLLLVGTLAIDRLWGKTALSEAVGRSKRRADLGAALLIPLPHPSGASRWLNDPENKARLDRALRLVALAWRGLPSPGAPGKGRPRR